MSKRWTHAESEERSISQHSTKLLHADISSWSHATSKPFGSVFKPIRPEVGVIPRVSRPIGSIKAVSHLHSNPPKGEAWNPDLVSLPADTEESIEKYQAKMKGDSKVITESAVKAEKFYASRIISKNDKVIQSIPDDLFEKVSPEEIERMKERKIEVPRDI